MSLPKNKLSKEAAALEGFIQSSDGISNGYTIMFDKWFNSITNGHNSPDIHPIRLLGLLIYWTRPGFDASENKYTRKTDELHPYLSILDIMIELDLSYRQVHRSLKKLQQIGVIKTNLVSITKNSRSGSYESLRRFVRINIEKLLEISIYTPQERQEIRKRRIGEREKIKGKHRPSHFRNGPRNTRHTRGITKRDTLGDFSFYFNTTYYIQRFLQNAICELEIDSSDGDENSSTSSEKTSTGHSMTSGKSSSHKNSSNQVKPSNSAKGRKRTRKRNSHAEAEYRPGFETRASHESDIPSRGSGQTEGKCERKSPTSKRVQRAISRRPKSAGKKKGPVPHENKPNLLLLEWWNQQPNLRNHRSGTKIYSDCLRKLQYLRNGKLSQIISMDSLDEKHIPHDWYSKKWRTKDIKKAISTLQEWTKEGNQPANKAWLKKMSLADIIYNPRTGRSVLMQAFKFGVTPLFDPSSELNELELKQFNFMKDFLEKYQTKRVNGQFDKQIAELIKDLSGLREKYPNAWDRVRHMSVGAGNVAGLVRDYKDYLDGIDYPEHMHIKLRQDVTPRALMRGGYLWKQFVQAFSTYYNVDPIEGQILN